MRDAVAPVPPSLAKERTMLDKIWIAMLCLGACGPALAEEPASADEAQQREAGARQFEASLRFQQGEITLPGGIAALQVPAGFRYVGPDDARRVLEDGWGNPEGDGTLGMLFPAEVSVVGADGWGVVITYEEDGHVEDADADSIDYDALLADMREGVAAENDARRDAGYEAIELVGWAAKPRYDKAARKLYWAKELKFGDSADHTLNYNIRILGRKGVLVLNAVSDMGQLGNVERDMQQVLAFTNFTGGNRYEDFDASIDKVAAYGLGALVAGGVAAKTGLLAKLLALLVAFKKFIILGAVVAAGMIGKVLFGRKDQSASTST
jgi:uncharacterized membrane-anchored protein